MVAAAAALTMGTRRLVPAGAKPLAPGPAIVGTSPTTGATTVVPAPTATIPPLDPTITPGQRRVPISLTDRQPGAIPAPAPPNSTAQNASNAIILAQQARDKALKRAAAGNMLVPAPSMASPPSIGQARTLLGG